MESMDEVREELRHPSLELHELIPEVMKGYVEMSSAAMKEGELSSAVKELLALVIATTRECDGCIVAHASQQVAEALGVAVAMNGGPGTVWGPRALRVFDEAQAARRA